MRVRAKIYQQLEPKARQGQGLSFTNKFIVFLVLASLIAFAMETEPSLSQIWKDGLNVANVLIVGIFAGEYILRVWSAGENPAYRGVSGRLKYMTTAYSLADLIAFLPELVAMILFPQLLASGSVSSLRLLRLARLFKIARLIPAFDILARALIRAGSQLLTSVALAIALIFVSAVALYYIEGGIAGQEAGFGSIPRAIWWAVATLTTVGYGDVYPVTAIGRFAAGIIALAGVGVVALPTGIFASAFADELREWGRKPQQGEAAEVDSGEKGA